MDRTTIPARAAQITPPAATDRLQWEREQFFKEAFVVEQNREVEQAVSALTIEILKLSPLEGDAKQALSVTIENAFSRLALAIMAQSNETQEEALEEALEEATPAGASA